MTAILLWLGIALLAGGWLGLMYLRGRNIARGAEDARFPERRRQALLRRSYCRFAMLGGIALLLIYLSL